MNNPALPISRDVKALEDYYKSMNRTPQKSSNPDVYELAEFYIRSNPDAHYIFDEVPIIADEGKIIFKFVN